MVGRAALDRETKVRILPPELDDPASLGLLVCRDSVRIVREHTFVRWGLWRASTGVRCRAGTTLAIHATSAWRGSASRSAPGVRQLNAGSSSQERLERRLDRVPPGPKSVSASDEDAAMARLPASSGSQSPPLRFTPEGWAGPSTIGSTADTTGRKCNGCTMTGCERWNVVHVLDSPEAHGARLFRQDESNPAHTGCRSMNYWCAAGKQKQVGDTSRGG